MKSTLLSIICCIMFSINAFGQDISSDLQNQITALGEGEAFEMKYVKTGCWGTYEGGGIIFTSLGDSIEVTLTNQQVYLGSEAQTTSSNYQVDELLQTLEENKKSFSMDQDYIVFANTFEYRLEVDGEKVVAGKSALEPRHVINKVALSNSLLDSFLGNQKGVLKNTGVIKSGGKNN